MSISRKRLALIFTGVIGLVGITVGLMKLVGLASVQGNVKTFGNGYAGSRVVLMQGQDVEAMVHFVDPFGDFLLERGSVRWTEANGAGDFNFSAVRWTHTALVGVVEFQDGRVCMTNPQILQPALGTYNVELTPNTQCWHRRETN